MQRATLTRERVEHAVRLCHTPGEAHRRLQCTRASLARALRRYNLHPEWWGPDLPGTQRED